MPDKTLGRLADGAPAGVTATDQNAVPARDKMLAAAIGLAPGEVTAKAAEPSVNELPGWALNEKAASALTKESWRVVDKRATLTANKKLTRPTAPREGA